MFSKTMRSLIAVTLAALLLTACGGSGGSDSSSDGDDGAGSVDRGPQGDITGQVIKGVVKNGVVSLYAVVNGYVKAEPLATTLTDDQGRYAINYNGDYQGVALLKLSVNKEAEQVTRMTCDIKPDCGAGTSFGEDFVLEDGFFLQAAIAEVNTGTKLTVNINALTDLAAAYSLPPSQYPDDVSAASIKQANQDIAELFGLSGSILAIPSTDITHADLVDAADNMAVKNALFSSAILAVMQTDTELGLVEQLRRLRQLYISNDGSFLTESDGAEDVSIFDILNASEALAEELGVKTEIMTAMLQYKNSIDSDGDGLGDMLDVFPHNPNEKYDKDKDGVGDNADACDDDPTDFVDTDRDGVCNLSDAFPNKRSEWSDIDGDGIGDNADYLCPDIPNILGEPCVDVDLDHVADSIDNCPTIANTDQADNYGSSFGDACDDTDGDGETDSEDNCPITPNTDQADNYGSSFGDACDDTDGDGKTDSEDNCPLIANEDQADFNDTGLPDSKGDACEDSDGDGVRDDKDEYPADATLAGDSDGDGVDDLVDVFPDDDTRWDPSPFAGRYRITGDTLIKSLNPPDVIVSETGYVDWSLLGYRAQFTVDYYDGSFSGAIAGIGSMSGRIHRDGKVLGYYYAPTLGITNGGLTGDKVPP